MRAILLLALFGFVLFAVASAEEVKEEPQEVEEPENKAEGEEEPLEESENEEKEQEPENENDENLSDDKEEKPEEEEAHVEDDEE